MGAKDLGSVQIVLTSLICVRGLPINSCTFNMLVLKHSFWKPHIIFIMTFPKHYGRKLFHIIVKILWYRNSTKILQF